MPKEANNIRKYNHGEKSIKIPFIIYADIERSCFKVPKDVRLNSTHIFIMKIQNKT